MSKSYKDKKNYEKKQSEDFQKPLKNGNSKRRKLYTENIEDSLEGEGYDSLPRSAHELLLGNIAAHDSNYLEDYFEDFNTYD